MQINDLITCGTWHVCLGEFSILSYFYGCMSGIGIAAVYKTVASAFLVRVQRHPLYKNENNKESW